jgi:CRP/FNR family transcriptional regulator, cyclic AMP receptor protein
MLGNDKQSKAMVDLFRGGTKLTYKKGEFIIRPGETPSGVFFIQEGLVKAYDITKYGEENLLIIRKSGEVFPLIRPITGKGPDIIYQALNNVVVWRLENSFYSDFLNTHDEILRPLLEMVIAMYQSHSERILNLEYRTVRERLVSFLLTMSKRFGRKVDHGVLIDVPLKHQDIASSISATRETTGRELSNLERKGLISNSQSTITIKDIKALRKFL